MKEFIEKLISRLEEKFKYNSEQAEIYRSGSDKDAYFREKEDLYRDRANTYGEVMRIVNQLAEEYKHCIKSSCSNCEVYDKEKHYCPKWCDVIKGTVAEIEEDRWIPCSERLPQENEPVDTVCEVVNVMLKSGTVTSGWCNRYLERWYVLDEHCDYPLQQNYEDVIAWQPLPAPFESKGE